jgi:uncharacterized LabA/DUF88 family protein
LNPRFAILLDGGFVTKALSVRAKRFPSAAEVQAECGRIRSFGDLRTHDLLRVYFYDAPPATGSVKNPIDGSVTDLGKTPIFQRHTRFLNEIELMPDFALRRGETVVRGWKMGKAATTSMLRRPASPTAQDLVPNVQQKGVDLRFGLDIARLALRGVVQAIVAVTGDSDLVPAFKFARREGVRIYLDHLGMPIRRELAAHADLVITQKHVVSDTSV